MAASNACGVWNIAVLHEYLVDDCWIIVWLLFALSVRVADDHLHYKQDPMQCGGHCHPQWILFNAHDTNRWRHVKDKLSKKYHFWPPLNCRLLKISPPQVEKPMSGTELYHHANFYTDQPVTFVPGQKHTHFSLQGTPLWATVLYKFYKAPVEPI